MRAVCLAGLIAVGIVSARSAYGGWFTYDNYEDCMLGRMKGQDKTMYLTADKACKKQFGVEFDVWSSRVKWKLEFTTGARPNSLRWLVIITDAPEDTEITSGKFLSANNKADAEEHDCTGITDADFGQAASLRFEKGEAQLPPNLGDKICVRAQSFKGRYK